MQLQQYMTEIKRTRRLTEKEDLLKEMSLGALTELGESMDILKKHLYQGHLLDRIKLEEELGDTFFYVFTLIDLLGLDFNQILQGNINKLLKRYPNGFSKMESINREK